MKTATRQRRRRRLPVLPKNDPSWIGLKKAKNHHLVPFTVWRHKDYMIQSRWGWTTWDRWCACECNRLYRHLDGVCVVENFDTGDLALFYKWKKPGQKRTPSFLSASDGARASEEEGAPMG